MIVFGNLTASIGIAAAQAAPDAGAGASPTAKAPGALSSEEQRKLKAAAELREEEHQRILGVMPNFNTSNHQDAASLSPGQKMSLALKGAVDPFTFFAAAIDAGLNQAENDFPAYRQGGEGYAKRFGASYADTFSSTMLGNALLPALLKQDPRYFRKATGSFMSRLLYAALFTVRCKDDDGKWAPNYSNLLGNIAAGGISNVYYPAADRGVGLTFQRAAAVTAEGTINDAFVEFWPDISRRLFRKHSGENLP